MRPRPVVVLLVALAVLFSACRGEAIDDDAGPGAGDAPVLEEGEGHDGGPRDASPPRSSGSDDADHGASPDADPDDRPAGDDAVPPAREVVDTGPPPSPPPGRDDLVDEASALLAAAREQAGDDVLAVHVVDEHDRSIVSHRPEESVLPASTLKIVTAAAALTTFGPDAVFRTRVEVTAPVDGDGRVAGDLVLVGSGDPVLATEAYARWVYPARPRTPLEDLADAVVDAGVRRVDGDVVGIADRFDGPRTADGWPDRYFSGFDARYADGLTVDAGLRTLVTYPEPDDDADDADDGDEAELEEGETDAAGGADDDAADEVADDADDDADADDVDPDVDPDVRVDHAPEPAAHATDEFARLLVERGVEVGGQVHTDGVDAPFVGRLASVDSPPVRELVRFAVQRSDNQITDALFLAVGRARTGVGSFTSGERALVQVLEHLGVDATGARFADGSGLSRDDRVTARLLVDLDRAMHAGRHRALWRSLMAAPGEPGTLERRLADGVASGRFAGKTGTLRDVISIVGTVTGDDGRRYHLAVLAHDPGGARWVGRVLADELITLLAADGAGCRAAIGDGNAGALGIAPLSVAC